MRLHRLNVQGFRKLKNIEIIFADATYLIGPNNTGKSSIFRAIEILLSGEKRIRDIEYHSTVDVETGENKTITNQIILEAEFRNLPAEASTWIGFKGRILSYDIPQGSTESGLKIIYRKTYELGKDVKIELLQKTRTLKPSLINAKTYKDLVDNGLPAKVVEAISTDLDKKLGKNFMDLINSIDEAWDVGTNEEWFENPGGIPGNVLSRLPKFLLIPADTNAHEIQDEKKGVLNKTLGELFEDVRTGSSNYKEAQKYLDLLALELNPNDGNSEFGKMLKGLNEVIGSVFPESTIHAKADLSKPDDSIIPKFVVEMSSNIKTPVNLQGNGVIRSAVFGLLRYRQRWISKRAKDDLRSLIICFEEPELYLHPSAATQMRETIYELAGSNSQIVCTTHSPYMIDLSKDNKQVLNTFRYDNKNDVFSTPLSITEKFQNLLNDEKNLLKMLLKIDDQIARSFFAKKAIIIEGDSELVAIKETLQLLDTKISMKLNSDFEIVRARGKATIIALANYFNALNLDFTVIHDKDSKTVSVKYNEPIKKAAKEKKVIVLEECLEETLGYKAPNSEKPYTVYKFFSDRTLENLPSKWTAVISEAFEISM